MGRAVEQVRSHLYPITVQKILSILTIFIFYCFKKGENFFKASCRGY